MTSRLIYNINDLITLEPMVNNKKLTGIDNDGLGRVKKSWLLVKNGKIEDHGQEPYPEKYLQYEKKDVNGALVLPGLIDCHTHPVFSGNRSKEFAMRLDGVSYKEIAAQGGGIKYTVNCTRNASDDELFELAQNRLKTFLSWGVTTVEAKSGYGLSVDEELRHLRIIQNLKNNTLQTIKSTCLALHAVPAEYESTEKFVKLMTEELLPRVKEEALADFVDAFVEIGFFTPEQTRIYAEKALELGFKMRFHADEFLDSGAAKFSAQYRALSADHLECASDEGISEMAAVGTIAVLLPGTSLYSRIPFANARRFIDRKVPVALSTDFNPGSCCIDNLPLIATVGALHCGLKPAEAIAAVTYLPAVSLELGRSKGALSKGFDADFIVHSKLKTLEDWLADIGRTRPDEVWIKGECVISS